MMATDGDGDADTSSVGRRRRRPEPTPTQRALSLLTRREHSRVELERKLLQRGVEAGLAMEAINRLTEAGWQNDARFAASLVRSRAESGYGPLYVRAELKTHGLPSAQIDEALGAYEGDWLENMRHLLERRYPQAAESREVQRKAIDFLLRRGFALELIYRVLREE